MLTLTGVLGFPVGHSRSPAMMNAAFGELGLDWRYQKLPVPPALFAETVRALPGSRFVGANVTIPHKLAAFELADEHTAAAKAIGAANTLTFRDGRITADNTDAAGFLDALGEPIPQRALVLGAGGAARAVVWALNEARVEDIAVWNRTPARAAAIAENFGVRHLESPGPAELIVNATSVGLGETATGASVVTELRLSGVHPPAVLVDLVYGDEQTGLAAWAAERGARVVDGLEVLVRQGARSLRAWTGEEPPIEVLRAAATHTR